MIKAVNVKTYRFGKLGNRYYKCFGMIDTETNEFLSFDGLHKYVLTTKKLIQSCIDADWTSTLKRVKIFA